MAIITGALVVREDTGERVPADCHGNNAAVACPECSHPILLIARADQRGSRQDRRGICQNCAATVWMTSPVDAGVEVNEVRLRARRELEAPHALRRLAAIRQLPGVRPAWLPLIRAGAARDCPVLPHESPLAPRRGTVVAYPLATVRRGKHRSFRRLVGGGSGIRTHGPRTRSTVFKTAAFDLSAIPPAGAGQGRRPRSAGEAPATPASV